MKIVFIGSVKFSETCLNKLIALKHPPMGVCTLEKSKFNSDHRDLTSICKKNNINVKYSPDINSKEIINWIKSLKPDIIFCFGWSRLIKEEILNIPKMGVVGYHPADLPRNRGRHPIIWSLALGLKRTASTFFFMDEKADSGDILSQEKINIEKNDNAQILYGKIEKVAIKQIEQFLPELESGEYKKIAQDNKISNTWRKRKKEDGRIDWRLTAESIHNLVRALSSPYPGAYFEFDSAIIKVWKTQIVPDNKKNIEPGKILEINKNGIRVKTGSDSIVLIQTNPQIILQKGEYL